MGQNSGEIIQFFYFHLSYNIITMLGQSIYEQFEKKRNRFLTPL
jgi:hypothetical protein